MSVASKRGLAGFPARLVALRTKAGESQEDLARALDVNVGAISRYERGINSPRAEHIALIARHYSVSTDHLILGDDDANRVGSKAFHTFLSTDSGKLALQKGWVEILKKMALPMEPTVQTYKNIVHALLSSEEDVNSD
jgi:transcriptional regulator with XRE-family HTH domain